MLQDDMSFAKHLVTFCGGCSIPVDPSPSAPGASQWRRRVNGNATERPGAGAGRYLLHIGEGHMVVPRFTGTSRPCRLVCGSDHGGQVSRGGTLCAAAAAAAAAVIIGSQVIEQ